MIEMKDCPKCPECIENDERVRSIERRLKIVMQEKDMAVELFQNSVQRIELLEDELHNNDDKKHFDIFKRQMKEAHLQMQSDYSDAIKILEQKLLNVSSELEFESKKVLQKEAELADLQKKINEFEITQASQVEWQKIEHGLRERCSELESRCIELESILRVRPTQALEDEERLTCRLENVEKQRDELQTALEGSQNLVEDLASQLNEARSKVSEAIMMVETTLVEKQQAQYQLVLCNNECRRLQKELMDLIEEAGCKVKNEVDAVKKNFEKQLMDAELQVNALEKERNKKINQLEKQQGEITKLEIELEEIKRKSVSPRKLQAISDQLTGAEKRVIELMTENKSLTEIIMQNQHRFESELSKCGMERRFLEQQVLKLQSNLSETGQNLERAVEHCNQLSDHLNKLSSELILERDAKECDSSELIKQLQLTKIQSSSAMQELKRFVNAHNSITSKWKDEYATLTMKFNDRMKELKIENRLEKKRYKRLLKQLGSSHTLERSLNLVVTN
ncbi:sodium channel and clathrin linker 1-like isoform X2 [Lycorma delicatula]|uniref:sodium channel and clathrin linker 1-like isoform X2 n=1 Tax=Lycorma delicatula TaxID=130591 RepID=UPI003F513FE4